MNEHVLGYLSSHNCYQIFLKRKKRLEANDLCAINESIRES